MVIIGGGPSGSAVGRLLASWGHHVLLLDNSDPATRRARGLAESLPPSTRKVLAQTGLLDVVDGARFYQSTGNTVSWGLRERRVESFGGALGYQVWRPDFDRLVLDSAAAAGVELRLDAHVRDVEIAEDAVTVHYVTSGVRRAVSCAWVLDCSGRAGAIARRFRTPGRRTYALAGEWISECGWRLPDPTHTLVEAYTDGWSWSVPLSPTLRHAGVMVDGASPRRDGRALSEAYRAEIGKSAAMAEALREATLQRVWACDASTYGASCCGGKGFLFVGDAASFIDPLSSFGVKKALASAWLAAVVTNTCLVDAARMAAAIGFFANWEREVSATHAQRSREFAREAAARFPSRFWLDRAAGDRSAGGPNAREEPAVDPVDVRAALRRIRERDTLELSLDERVVFASRPLVRGREIVIEEALSTPPAAPDHDSTGATRFVENVDVVALARLAGRHRSVPDLFAAYCEYCGPAPLPNVLGALSWLMAAGVLRQRNAVPC